MKARSVSSASRWSVCHCSRSSGGAVARITSAVRQIGHNSTHWWPGSSEWRLAASAKASPQASNAFGPKPGISPPFSL